MIADNALEKYPLGETCTFFDIVNLSMIKMPLKSNRTVGYYLNKIATRNLHATIIVKLTFLSLNSKKFTFSTYAAWTKNILYHAVEQYD